MENKKSNNTLVVLVVILSILVLGLSAYIVYDKVLDTKNGDVTEKDNDKKQDDEDNKQESDNKIKEEDSAFFDEYLKLFLPSGSANNFKKTINEFSDKNISDYLYFYYISLANNGDIEAKLTDGIYTYDVSKEEMDKVVYKYFGINDYDIVVSTSRTGIRKLDNGEYQVFWFTTGWTAPDATNTLVKYDGNNVVVEYKLTNDIYGDYGEESKLTFNLVYNDGNYNVISVIYEE